jgi:N-acetylglucosamine kinase-like BadF-type ATPase
MDAHGAAFPSSMRYAVEKCDENSGLKSRRQGVTVPHHIISVTTVRGESIPNRYISRMLFSVEYVLGFDGGGTKTECVLMDSAGGIVARSVSGPSNPTRVGVEAATSEIKKAAELVLRESGAERSAVVALGAGLAGTGQPEMKLQMQASLEGAFPGIVVTLLTDLQAALAATGKAPAIVLVAGTGSGAIGRDEQGQIWRAGGYGPPFSDEGSSFSIGSRAVARAMSEREEQGRDSILGEAILRQFGCAAWAELQQRASVQPDKIFPPIFPIVAVAADAGDSTAREILQEAACQLADLVKAVANHAGLGGENVVIVKTGGTVGRSAFYDAQVDEELRRVLPQAKIGELQMSPAEAAARAARE